MEDILSEFNKNILLWYPFKKDCSVLNLEYSFGNVLEEIKDNFSEIVSVCENIDFQNIKNEDYLRSIYNNSKSNENIYSKKYDYVMIIGNYSLDFSNKLEFARKFIKKDGKILIALDNKFGLKNWNRAENLNIDISQSELKNKFEEVGIKNYKFYYVFPNYKSANLIYSSSYNITEEDISRNFPIYSKDNIVTLNENETYKELLKEGKEFFNNFANSFFVELSEEEITTNIKYVTYSNYRKKEYRVMTIIKDNLVEKKAVNKEAVSHINNIAKNIDTLEKMNIKTIENFKENYLESSFIQAKRFDNELIECNTIDEFMNKFNLYKNLLNKNLIEFSTINKNKLRECIQNYDEDKIKKLHFVKDAFIDLIPKNIFYINGQFNVFDQEWLEEYLPVEYIYYRAIINSNNCATKFGKDTIFRKIKINEYIDLFEDIEKELKEKIIDKKIYNLFYCVNVNIPVAEHQRISFREQTKYYKEKYLELSKKNYDLNLELEDARGKVVDYANQVRAIAGSIPWRITKPLRYLMWFFNFKSGVSLFDKLYPIGSKRRIKYDEKKRVELENKKLEDKMTGYMNATDSETVKYWLEIEKREEKRRKELFSSEDLTVYEMWQKTNDPTPEELEKQRGIKFGYEPKISIVVPLYNTPKDFFRELLFSLYRQTYTNWELCLADGSDKELVEIKELCKDSRIKYKFIGENKGISGNTNEALKMVTGDYVALLDHDDLLPLNSLYEIVKCINENPEVRFIYTDEDKISNIDEPRYDPHFKPDYAPDYLRSGNYICHFSIFKKELMDKLKGFRSDYDGAQDFDIILRATEEAKPEEIKHIARILYHWRVHRNSTAGNSESKLYAYESGKKAVQHHIDRLGLKGKSERHPKMYGIYEVKYDVIGKPKVNILIPNYNDKTIISECINNILDITTYENYEIDILDNNTKSIEVLEFYKEIEKNGKVKILYSNETVNYSKLINNAVNNADGEFIVTFDKINEIVNPDWLEVMLGNAERQDVGAVTGKILYPNKKIKYCGIIYGVNNFAEYMYQGMTDAERVIDRLIHNTSCITTSCMMIERKKFEEIGGMDENYSFSDTNEVDFSFKLREKNYLLVYTPQVQMYDNYNSIEDEKISLENSFNHDIEVEKVKENWKEFFIKPDPYYNPNFSPVDIFGILRIDKVWKE